MRTYRLVLEVAVIRSDDDRDTVIVRLDSGCQEAGEFADQVLGVCKRSAVPDLVTQPEVEEREAVTSRQAAQLAAGLLRADHPAAGVHPSQVLTGQVGTDRLTGFEVSGLPQLQTGGKGRVHGRVDPLPALVQTAEIRWRVHVGDGRPGSAADAGAEQVAFIQQAP